MAEAPKESQKAENTTQKTENAVKPRRPRPVKTILLDEVPTHIEEYVFQRKMSSNGYKVTVAAIRLLETNNVFVGAGANKCFIGASACSPEDAFDFDARKARKLALGRAYENLFAWNANGAKPFGTLVEHFSMGDWVGYDLFRHNFLQDIVEIVGRTAERRAVEKQIEWLEKRFPHWTFKYSREI